MTDRDGLGDAFGGYDPGGYFCELTAPRQGDGGAAGKLCARIAAIGLDALRSRAVAAERDLFDLGITFTVYSEAAAIDRILPFDSIPRLITPAEWHVLEAGVRQRVAAINALLHDIYHRQHILRDGVIPRDLVLGNANYRPEMQDFPVRFGTYAHICGIDIVRDAAGEFLVLEDNARTPSGVSYVVENRHLMARAFPDLMAGLRLRPVDDYGRRLRAAMVEIAPESVLDPQVVLLSPGIHNSAYFEHVFLSREMGVPLVEGGDLVVEDDRLWMRTTAGLRAVHTVYRRINDDFLDPTVFRPDSALGGSGPDRRLAARQRGDRQRGGDGRGGRQGGVCVHAADHPLLPAGGSGSAERGDAYLPGEGRICVHARTHGTSGGQAGGRIRRLRHHHRPAGDRRRAGAGPRGPGGGSGELDLPAGDRPFRGADAHPGRDPGAASGPAAVRGDGTGYVGAAGRTNAGGVAGREPGGELVAGWRVQGHLGAGRGRLMSGEPPLLARYAEGLFWLARYLERIENLGRLIDVTQVFESPGRETESWLALLQINADVADFSARGLEPDPEQVKRYYLCDARNASSIPAALAAARLNARGLRPLISTEMWVHLTRFHREISRITEADLLGDRLSRVCALIKEGVQAHTGITEGTFHRDQGWLFYQLGRLIERADQTTRLLDIRYHLLVPGVGEARRVAELTQWSGVLRGVAGYHAFRRVAPPGFTPADVVAFLLLDAGFPRSVAGCLLSAEDALHKLRGRYGLRGTVPALQRIEELRGGVTGRPVAAIIGDGLHEFLDGVQRDLALLSAEIADAFFRH